MPTTDQHSRSSTARSVTEDAARVAVPAWPSRDLERRDGRAPEPGAESDTTTPAEPVSGDGSGADDGARDGSVPGPAAPTAGAADSSSSRRATFLADLTRAMRTAAEAQREEVLARFREDAESRNESLRTESSAASDRVREKADQDVATLEAWCAEELERIRRQADESIADRRSRLTDELAAEESRLEASLASVAEAMAAFERQMADFFERLLAEEDPSTFAVMARQLPEPPSLVGWPAQAGLPDAGASSPAQVATHAPLDADALAAAEAEAAQAIATTAPDGETGAPGDTTPAPPASPETEAATRWSVAAVGLVSVASVSSFKRMLSRVEGVRAVQVASGPQGEFIFSLTADDRLDLAAAVTSLPGFSVEVRATGDRSVDVLAHDLEQE